MVKEHMDKIIHALKTDEEYRQSWVANIAMAMYDEACEKEPHMTEATRKKVHRVANAGAERFINQLTHEAKDS